MTLPDILPFEGLTSNIVQLWLDYDDQSYFVRYKYGTLTIEQDDVELVCQDIGPSEYNEGSSWSDEETTVYLGLISEAIRQGTLETLLLPMIAATPGHPWYCKGPIPSYAVGLVCGKETPPDVRLPVMGNRHDRKRVRLPGVHYHSKKCIQSMPACDVADWIANHPVEHKKLI